jgi:hypothetical protein
MQQNDNIFGDLTPSLTIINVTGAGTDNCNGIYEQRDLTSYLHQEREEYCIQLVSGGTWVLKHEDSFLYQLQM